MTELDDQTRRNILRRSAATGPIVIPRTDLFTWTDKANEEAVLSRITSIAKRHGADIMGIAEVPTQPYRFMRKGVNWLLEPMDLSREYDVPQTAYNRWQGMQADGAKFMYYLWAEEQYPQPQLRPIPDRAPQSESQIIPSWLSWLTTTTKLRDPMFIGVVATMPGRGVWCVLGEWFH